jgi:hypothetical protein
MALETFKKAGNREVTVRWGDEDTTKRLISKTGMETRLEDSHWELWVVMGWLLPLVLNRLSVVASPLLSQSTRHNWFTEPTECVTLRSLGHLQ